MPLLAIGLGVLLILVGLSGFFASGMASWTALIPAFFGFAFAALGAAGRAPSLRKTAMHSAAALALLGLIATARGVVNAFYLASGQAVERPGAAVSQAIMALGCLVFLIFAVKSFVDARRSRALV